MKLAAGTVMVHEDGRKARLINASRPESPIQEYLLRFNSCRISVRHQTIEQMKKDGWTPRFEQKADDDAEA